MIRQNQRFTQHKSISNQSEPKRVLAISKTVHENDYHIHTTTRNPTDDIFQLIEMARRTKEANIPATKYYFKKEVNQEKHTENNRSGGSGFQQFKPIDECYKINLVEFVFVGTVVVTEREREQQ